MNWYIRELLDKKNITGEEFGKAYMFIRLQERMNSELILTNKKFKILLNKVTEPLEIDNANAYIECYNFLDRSYLITKKYYEYFFVGLSILYHKLEYTVDSELGFYKLKKITEGLSKKDNDYQKLKEFTKNILAVISVFNQVEGKENLKYLKFVQNARGIITVSLSNVLSYNKAIDLFTDFLKIPEIKHIFKIETYKMFEGIDMLNDRIILVKNSLYGSEEEIAKKSKILNDICPITNISDFLPTEATVKKASKLIKGSIVNFNFYQVMKILQGKV